MVNDLKKVFVFIASPGDVADARDSVRKAIELINRLVAKDNGFLLEPIGWEDVPPGKGNRAQEIINPYIDMASIFIGILNRRFGQPTGKAESGTEEEYNRITNRWNTEEPKPEVMIYFKKIPVEILADPGEQLKKVLTFKQKISKTDFYKEFESEKQLEILIQDALHDWVLRTRNVFGTPNKTDNTIIQQPNDKEVLAYIIKHEQLSADEIGSHFDQSETAIQSSIQRLKDLGLIVEETQGMLKPINSTEGFLSIVRQLNTDKHYMGILSSNYFQKMLNLILGTHILSRFHCEIQPEMIEALQCVALLSPGTTNYLLFGDTSFYDNAFESMIEININDKKHINELLRQRIILNSLLQYGIDYTSGKILTELRSNRLAGQLFSVGLKVAFEETKAFEIQIGMPQIGAYAGCDCKAGKVVVGHPEFFIRQGIIYMHLDLDDLADEAFGHVLSNELPNEIKAMAFNNKGCIYLRRKDWATAVSLFKLAIEHNDSIEDFKKNLTIAETELLKLQKEKTNEQ